MPTNPGTDSLAAWWSLDETSGTRYDAHGANHLTDNNTVGYAAGKQSNAADFEATNNEYFSLTNIAFADDTAWSVSLWFNQESWPSGYGCLLGSNASYLFIYNSGLKFRIDTEGATADWDVSLSTGTWYHVVATCNGADSNNLSLYLNGSQVGSALSKAASGFNINAVGRIAGSLYMDGLIDEASAWNDELTADEVSWLYNSGAGRAYSELLVNPGTTNLAAWWSLDETSGTRNDSHGSNHLTDYNTVGYAAGVVDNSADFVRGNAECLYMGRAALFEGATSFSLSWWHLLDLNSGTHTAFVEGDAGYRVLVYARSNVICFLNGTGNSGTSVGNAGGGAWEHITIVYDGSQADNSTRLKIYRDGIQDTGLSFSGTIPSALNANTSTRLALGAIWTGASAVNPVDGQMDEFALFNDALTADEVAWLRNSGAGRAYSDLGGGAVITPWPILLSGRVVNG